MQIYELLWTVGNKICHQMPSRSYFIYDYQIPVCTRCFAIFVSFIATCSFAYRYRESLYARFENAENPMRSVKDRLLTAVLVVPLVIDGMTQTMGLRLSCNALRTVTGAIFGIAAGIGCVFTFQYLYTHIAYGGD